MSIKVCDALCGSGKTSAAIRMMNEQTDRKFIFVTQYLSEVERIKTSCAARGFVSPEASPKTGLTKLSDIHDLMRNGRNIATTHALFMTYTDETRTLIREQGYVLILDEVIDVISVSELSRSDLNILLDSGCVKEDGEYLRWVYDDYSLDERNKFKEEMLRAKSNNMIKYDDRYYCWIIPPDLFTSFTDVYVLTYMFHAQSMRCFFEISNIDYELIGTARDESGFVFCPLEAMNRVRDLRDKIHVLENGKVNEIGAHRNALSFSWYQNSRRTTEDSRLNSIRKNIINVFRNIWRARGAETLWTTYKEYQSNLEDRGYINSFVVYNKRATNEYSDRKYLAYCINNFPRPWEAKFFRDHGSEMHPDGYALSILIQWIFRSAIRNDEDIWVYIPSARMRGLLTQWLDKLATGNDLDEIKYATPRQKASKKKRKNAKQSV